MITLTDTAAVKVKDLLDAEGRARDGAAGRGPPRRLLGFTYEMFFDTDIAGDDEKAEFGGVRVVVDPSSAQLLDGRHARLQGRPPGGRFQHQQPERPRTCGCGNSFS